MQVNIKATNIKLDSEDKLLIQEKMESLDKFFSGIQQIRFEIEKSILKSAGKVFRAEANIVIPKKLVRIEKQANDWRKAMEKVKDHAKRVLSEEKKKMIDKQRKQK